MCFYFLVLSNTPLFPFLYLSFLFIFLFPSFLLPSLSFPSSTYHRFLFHLSSLFIFPLIVFAFSPSLDFRLLLLLSLLLSSSSLLSCSFSFFNFSTVLLSLCYPSFIFFFLSCPFLFPFSSYSSSLHYLLILFFYPICSSSFFFILSSCFVYHHLSFTLSPQSDVSPVLSSSFSFLSAFLFS